MDLVNGPNTTITNNYKLFTTITNNDLIVREKKYKTSECSFICQWIDWIQFRCYQLVKNCKHAIQATSLYK